MMVGNMSKASNNFIVLYLAGCRSGDRVAPFLYKASHATRRGLKELPRYEFVMNDCKNTLYENQFLEAIFETSHHTAKKIFFLSSKSVLFDDLKRNSFYTKNWAKAIPF